MEPPKEPISVRVSRLNSQIVGRSQGQNHIVTREGLYDALVLLYDECNTDILKRADKNMATFVDKYRSALSELKQSRVNLNDFEIKGIVGRGHFGEVRVVREKHTGDVYAMKTIKKSENADVKRVSFEEERDIMAFSKSPWITPLQYSFQDEIYLFFIMEYLPGGDLHNLLCRQGGTLPESAATFYIAETVLALNDLHAMGYIHRDVKPGNILLDRCGHVKLADFGSAVKLNKKGVVTEGLLPAGTPDYVAPEVLLSTENKHAGNTYGIACDYWSLGILAYELTIGNSPFASNSTKSTYSKIMDYGSSLKFPPDILLSQAYVSFIKGLIVEQSSRLDYKAILKHSLFKNIDFSSLRDQVPPFVPKIKSDEDTSNFSDVQPKKNEPSIANFKRKTQFSGRNLPYLGFTYTADANVKKESFECVTIKRETDEKLLEEMDNLKKKLMRSENRLQEMNSLEKKYEEKCRKLESLENLRNRLERDAANSIAECTVLKRTIELERKERTELEHRALDLIKSAKQKWEASERAKVEALTLELDKNKEKVAQLTATNEMLNEQLQHALNLERKHKTSVDRVKNLNRQSVIGLESRIEKITTDTQSQITDLETKLNEQTNKNDELLKQLKTIEVETNEKVRNAQKESKNWMTKYEQVQKQSKTLQGKITNLETELESVEVYKQEIDELKSKLLEAQQGLVVETNNTKELLEREREKCINLEDQIKALRGEQNKTLSKYEVTVQELNKKQEELEKQLWRSSEEKEHLQKRLQEAYANDEINKSKVKTLEELLNRLEAGLSKLECGSDREDILQEQIERLEQQLAEVHGASAVDRQELAQLKTKYWKIEKDLNNSEIDKRILERELKEAIDENKQIKAEMESLIENFEKDKKNLVEQLMRFETLRRQLEENLNLEKEKCDKEKELIDDMCGLLQEKDDKIESLKNDINTLKSDKENIGQELIMAKNYCAELQGTIAETNRQKESVENELQAANRKLQNKQLNFDALRDACVLLESQLIEYEKMETSWQSKQASLNENTEKLIQELAKAKEDIQEAKKRTNEEKSLKLLAESKCRHFQEDVESLKNECESYKKQSHEYKEYSNQLSYELTSAEERITEYEVTIKSHERQIDEYVNENKYLKEENARQLSNLLSVKESNYKLNKHLSECKDINDSLLQRINELEALLQEKIDYYKERELKSTSTIQQQIKLIDYLQTKVEEGKKKKTLSDKIFGSKKENQPPISVVLNYKDLENRLQREQQLNKQLREENYKLKADSKKCTTTTHDDSVKGPISPKTKLALQQLVQSPLSQSNFTRQNSVQRMHHNIPHRFETKLCTKATKCVQCLNQIALGRNVNVCKECNVAAHVSCAKNVPGTCGLPKAYAKHFTNSLTKLNDNNNKNSEEANTGENVEGWVKIPSDNNKSWQKRYARLSAAKLSIYSEPNSEEIIDSFDLRPENGQAKLIVEPVPSELDIPVANSDLPFLIKIELSTTCWPTKCLVFMTLSVQDKEKWFKALHALLEGASRYTGEIVFSLPDTVYINSVLELPDNKFLLGTEHGLFIYNERLIELVGPSHVYQTISIGQIKKILMIANADRGLICCDFSHIMNLTLRSPSTRPTLSYKTVAVNGLSQFHILQAADFKRQQIVCTATSKQLIILKWDETDFIPIRILDTAEPTGCILFTDQTIIVGADKFFEIDLGTFKAELFLDADDVKLEYVRKYHTLKSYPLAIVKVNSDPIEFLLCYNEFAVFVDEFGRSSRQTDLKWTHVPVSFHYCRPYLYIVQFGGVEIVKITKDTGNVLKNSAESLVDLDSFRIEMRGPRFLGGDKKGVYISTGNTIKYLSASKLNDDGDDESKLSNTDNSESDEQFSFTSSMVQSLDGYLSDSDNNTDSSQQQRHVTFNPQTDL